MGVWIEMECKHYCLKNQIVTPCVGVWIEIYTILDLVRKNTVTPCVGVWIEIKQAGYKKGK